MISFQDKQLKFPKKKFTLIFAAREFDECTSAIAALKDLKYSPYEFEIFVALGRNPSAQRNLAACHSSGEWLLFLDNDSIVDPRLLLYYEDALSYSKDIGIIGGPSVHEPVQRKDFKADVTAVFSSAFGLGPLRSRYTPLGKPREVNGRELILSNLVIKRELFLKEGGFHPDFYPNEENEFMDRTQFKSKAFYHPLAICYREPRDRMSLFILQMIRYGIGRAKQIRYAGSCKDRVFLIPGFFMIYVVLLPFICTLLSGRLRMILMLPGFLYLLLALLASLSSPLSQREKVRTFRLPILFFTCHFFYGAGLVFGLCRWSGIKKTEIERIRLVKLEEFESDIPTAALLAN